MCTASKVLQCYYRARGNISKSHGNRMLSKQQENILLSVLLVFSSLHHGLTPTQAREEVKTMFNLNISMATMKRFLKRHKDSLRVTKSKLLAAKRTDESTLDSVADFCASLEEMRGRYKMMAKNTINYDETRIFVGQGGESVIERKDKKRTQRKGFKGRAVGSLVSFIAADGAVLMSVWIMKCEVDKETGLLKCDLRLPHGKHLLRGKWPRFFCFTQSTYNNSEVHRDIMKKFCEVWKLHNPNLHCYVFGDQLACHYDIETVRSSLQDHIFIWSLPANTSHFLKPLDDACFARLNQGIRTLVSGVRLSGSNTGEDVIDRIHSVAYEVEECFIY